MGARRERHVLGQLHVGHHGTAERRPAHPPELLAQRGDVRMAHRRQRPRRAPAHPADVPLQRLGDALRGDGHGRRARRAAQGRRRGDPVACRAPRRHAPVCRAGRRGGRPRSVRGARQRGSLRPRAGHRAHRGGRCAAAVQDDRAGGDRARMGVHSDLRADRDGAAAHHQPGAFGVGRARCALALRAAQPRRRPGHGRADRDGRRGRGAGARQSRLRRLLGAARGVGPGARGRVVPHRGRRLPRRGLPGHLGPQEGRHHHRRRERVVHRGRGLPVPAPCRGRGGGDRRARREVGRDDQGAGGGARRRDGHRGRADRALPRPPGPLQGADQCGAARRAGPDGDGEAAEVQAPPALLGGARAIRRLQPGERGVRRRHRPP